jgi:predicted ribonuclease YlaK
MGRKNRRAENYEPYFEEELYREFIDNEEMRQAKVGNSKKLDLKIKKVEPLTENQKLVFENYKYNHHLILHGVAGTGKTFLAFYLALCEVISKKYKKIVVVRSTVQSRDMGHLPGTIEEKT